jgi:hypothetical protein
VMCGQKGYSSADGRGFVVFSLRWCLLDRETCGGGTEVLVLPEDSIWLLSGGGHGWCDDGTETLSAVFQYYGTGPHYRADLRS